MPGHWPAGSTAVGGRSRFRQRPGHTRCDACCDGIAEGSATGAKGACWPWDDNARSGDGEGVRRKMQRLWGVCEHVPSRSHSPSTYGAGRPRQMRGLRPVRELLPQRCNFSWLKEARRTLYKGEL